MSRCRLAAILLLFAAAACRTTSPAARSRDRFPLDPREGLTGPFPSDVNRGWEELVAGDAARSRALFLRAEGRAAKIGAIEALVADAALPEALALCGGALADGDPTAALLVACGEAHARSGQAVAGWSLYAQALPRAPGRPGLEARAGELRSQARDELRREANEAAGREDWQAARQAAERAVAIDPESAAARETAGDVALAAGDGTAALAQYREGVARPPASRQLLDKIARLAMDLKDYAAAIPALDALAAEDPSYQVRAEEARVAFRVANWPAAERSAARAARLTRGEAADLLWWMVPEVRDAQVSAGVIASDVVGRADRLEISRAVSLGLLDADRETHRANPDGTLTFGSASRLYLRVLVFLVPREPLTCLEGKPVEELSSGEAIRVARECRLVGDTEGPPVGGAAFMRALDRVRILAAKGENGLEAADDERKRP